MSFFLKDHCCFQLIKIIYIEHLWKTFLSFYFFQLFSIHKSSSNFVSVQFTNITKKPVLNECKTIWSSTFHASSFSVVPDSLNALHKQLPGQRSHLLGISQMIPTHSWCTFKLQCLTWIF